MTQVKNKIV